MMLANSLIVSHNIIPCPGESAGIFAACSATRIDRRANLGVGIIQRIVIYQVEVEAGLEIQSFQESDLKEGTSGELIPHTLGFIIGQGCGQVPVGRGS